MKKLVLLVGIPGSGKSTVALRLLEKGFVCLNADTIRHELYGDAGEQGDKERVFEVFFERLEKELANSGDIVIDNTNINSRHRQPIIERARAAGYTDIQLWIIDTPLDICLERNRARSRIVPDDIVENYHKSLHGPGRPEKHEGRLVVVRPGKGPGEFRFFAIN